MSTRSKITLAATSVLCVVTIGWVHYVQESERAALHEGPKKDAVRMLEKKKLRLNESEHNLQLELRKKYELIQPLSGIKVEGVETSTAQDKS